MTLPLRRSAAGMARRRARQLPSLRGAAVGFGALLGPSQIVGRGIELAWGRKLHPIGSTFLSAALMALGVLGLTLDAGAAALAVVIYAAGAGVSFVIRGTLPLAMFGS